MKRPLVPPSIADLMTKIGPDRMVHAIVNTRAIASARYLHWDELFHKEPPAGLTTEEWWVGIKVARNSVRRSTPLNDRFGAPFWYAMPDEVLASLHRLDQVIGGQITVSENVTTSGSRDRYLMSSLIEEAITSSQMEGASTTRKVAKEMLRTGRQPRDRSERMIRNNFQAMQRIVAIADRDMSPELVLELHRIVTEGTLDDPQAAGRMQLPDEERVRVWDETELPVILHTPPDAAELPERLKAMCEFANAADSSSPFVHPVVRSIVLHFWLAYDHPFEDGNGRTARALFYWSMLSRGYWLAEFLSISSILRRGKVSYDRSFLYTETDENDLTYFIRDQLRVITRSVDELEAYLGRKQREVRAAETLLRGDSTLNHRQIALLSKALRDSEVRFTLRSHQRSHNVAYQTARTDLLDLEERGLLVRRKIGKAYQFHAVADLDQRLADPEVTT